MMNYSATPAVITSPTLPRRVYNSLPRQWGAGIAQWLERRTRDRKVPAGAAGEVSSPGSAFCADSYFGIRSTPVVSQ